MSIIAEFFFDTFIGKTVAAVTVVLAVFAGWLWRHDVKIERAAKIEVIEQANKQAEKLTHEAVKARAPAQRSGAADRLRRSSCADCNQ